jgi:hypothetical protein
VHQEYRDERGRAYDPPDAAQSLGKTLRAPRPRPPRRIVAHHQEHDEAEHRADDGDDEEARAPTDGGGAVGERRGGREHAEARHPELQPGERREALGREPAAVNHERPHEEARAAEAHEHAAKDQRLGVGAEREHEDARDHDRHRRRHHPPRPIAVDRDADRNLRRRERQKKRARQEPDAGSAEPDVLRKVGGDDAHGVAQELAHDVHTHEGCDQRHGDPQTNPGQSLGARAFHVVLPSTALARRGIPSHCHGPSRPATAPPELERCRRHMARL